MSPRSDMIVVFAALLALALYLVPAVIVVAASLARGADVRRTPLDVAVALAIDLFAILTLGRLLPIAHAVWITRLAWLGFAAWDIRARRGGWRTGWRTLRSLDAGAVQTAVVLAAATTALTAAFSYGYVFWDRDWHASLVSSMRAQSIPFHNVFVTPGALYYHYAGDVVPAVIQTLSFGVITASLALSAAHDLFLALSVVTLFAVLRAFVPRVRVGWLVAIAGSLALAGPASLLREGAVDPLVTRWSITLCGNSFLSFMTLGYRPHTVIAGYFMVVIASAVALRLAAVTRDVLPPRHAAAVYVSSVAALVLLDEASLAVLGVGLAAAWLVAPRALADTRARGLAVLAALAVVLVAVTLAFHGSLAPGGPVHATNIVPMRLLNLYSQPAWPLSSWRGRRELVNDVWPALGVALTAGLVAAWRRERALAGVAAFYGAIVAVGIVGMLKVEVNHTPDESQRFMTSAMVLAPVVSGFVLTSGARPGVLARMVLTAAIIVPSVSTLLWYKAFTEEIGADVEFGRAYTTNCLASTGAPRLSSPALRYVEHAVIWRYAPCQPTAMPGVLSTGWDFPLHPAFGASAVSGLRAVQPTNPVVSIVCAATPTDDGVCAWAHASLRCTPLVTGSTVVECPLDDAERAAMFARF